MGNGTLSDGASSVHVSHGRRLAYSVGDIQGARPLVTCVVNIATSACSVVCTSDPGGITPGIIIGKELKACLDASGPFSMVGPDISM